MSPPYSSTELLDIRSERLGAGFMPNQPRDADSYLGTVDVQNEAKYFKLALKHNTLTLNTSPPFHQHPSGAIPKHNSGGQSGYGYPAENQQLTWHRLDSQAMSCNCIIGKLINDSTINYAPNNEQTFTFGSQTQAGDEVHHDPLNMRAIGTLDTGDVFFYMSNGYYQTEYKALGFNGNSLQCPGLLRIDVSIEGQFTGSTQNAADENILIFEARQYDASHNLLATHRIGGIETGRQNFTKSRTKYLRTFDTTREVWHKNDYLKIVAINNTPAWRDS